MRKIIDIYKEYKIMPNLQEHQLRVAGVASQICESLSLSLDVESIIKACLLHDMGNIIKFNLKTFPEFNEPEGFDYWSAVQKEYIEKYGENEHLATVMIMKELGMSNACIELADANRFSWLCKHKDLNNFAIKIIHYADARVSPTKICSYDERMDDAGKRYLNHKNSVEEIERLRLVDCGKEIEKQIFEHSNIKPEDITDESIEIYLEKFKNFEL